GADTLIVAPHVRQSNVIAQIANYTLSGTKERSGTPLAVFNDADHMSWDRQPEMTVFQYKRSFKRHAAQIISTVSEYTLGPGVWSPVPPITPSQDRKSTRLNSSHVKNSYAVFCLQKNIYTRKQIVIVSFYI